MNQQCLYFKEKGENRGEQCTNMVKGGKRMYCHVHHRLMIKWLEKNEIKQKEPFDENVLFR